jgi:DNA-binding transcriptional MocR family regulator
MRKVDMTRGKPSEEQLSLAVGMERLGADVDPIIDGVDVRNYGVLDGIPAARALLGHLLGLDADSMIAWGNSSLTLMYLYARFLQDQFRAENPTAKAKWIAVTPGYDRHFAICEQLGIEMLSVPLAKDGPDMEAVEKILAQDPSVIGLWCVPKYSNPCGVTYSDACVRRCAALPQKAGKFFTVFWDNAYGVHDFSEETADQLLPLMKEAQALGTQDRMALFCSTSKISFAGSGIAGIGLSKTAKAQFLKHLGFMSICPDKVTQLKHVRFLGAPGALEQHMKKHAASLTPKFEVVSSTFAKILSEVPGVSWSAPRGGYFISLYLPKGTASKVCDAAAQKGVVLTKAGAAFPYGRDPNDAHLRIAPSYPSLEDVTYAAQVIAETVREVVRG